MIVATVTALIILFGGGNSLEHYLLNIKKPVKATVESKEVVKEVLGLSKELGKQLKTQNKELIELNENFLDFHRDYDAKLADFEVIIGKMMSGREKGQEKILNSRSEMKDLMTREEWTEIFSLRDD